MELLAVFGIAFGLAMDAFSVAVASGIALGKVSPRQAFRLSFHFGLFQFGMPIVGWILGSLVAEQIHSVGPWIAFGLLSAVGLKMIWEALRCDEEAVRGDPTRGASLVLLSVATSIDALAVGLGMALVGVPVLYPAVVIGAVAANMTVLGLYIGKRAGHLLGRRMEVVGGAVLVLIGVGALL
jgi:manganese efflux pump family protein